MGKRVCAEPGCPEVIDTPRCADHTRAKDKARGSRQQRGYDAAHDRERAAIQSRIDKGAAIHCVTCDAVLIGRKWDLGHNATRTGWIGPQCEPCNRGHHDPR